MPKRSPIKKLAALLRVLTVLVLGLTLTPCFAASTQRQFVPVDGSLVSTYNLPVFSDFDSDNKVDRAELSSDGPLKQVLVTFGKSSWSLLPFDSGVSERGRLLSEDIDHDGAADLIWVSQSFPQKLVLWFGDGRGNFSRASDNDPALDQIPELFARQSTALAGHGTDNSAGLILPTIHPVILSVVKERPFKASLRRGSLAVQRRAASAPFLDVLQKRGPPSRPS